MQFTTIGIKASLNTSNFGGTVGAGASVTPSGDRAITGFAHDNVAGTLKPQNLLDDLVTYVDTEDASGTVIDPDAVDTPIVVNGILVTGSSLKLTSTAGATKAYIYYYWELN